MLGFEIPDGNAGEPARKPDTEKEATKIEKEKPEHIPTPEEVRSLFEKLVGEADYEEIQKLEDEHGLYLWDIKITQVDGSIEYSYVTERAIIEKEVFWEALRRIRPFTEPASTRMECQAAE